MKKFHVRKENYSVSFKWTKPDEYIDGFLEKKSWYFSVCDWFGNELEGFYDENEMLEYIEDMNDEETEDIQVFAYPQEDGEKVEKSMNWLVLQEECPLVKQLLLKKNIFFLTGRSEKNF